MGKASIFGLALRLCLIVAAVVIVSSMFWKGVDTPPASPPASATTPSQAPTQAPTEAPTTAPTEVPTEPTEGSTTPAE